MLVINNVELNVDFTDADFIDKVDKASKKVLKNVDELKAEKEKKDFSAAEGIRQECKILKDFIDDVFGAGTSEQIFEGRNSLMECLQVYEDIINEKQKQNNILENAINKYSPDRLKR